MAVHDPAGRTWLALAVGLVGASLLVLVPGSGAVGIDLVDGQRDSAVPLLVLVLALALPVAWSPSRPVVVALVVGASFAVHQLAGFVPAAATLAVPATCFALGRRRRGGQVAVATGLVAAAVAGSAQWQAPDTAERWTVTVIALAVTVVPALVGRAMAAPASTAVAATAPAPAGPAPAGPAQRERPRPGIARAAAGPTVRATVSRREGEVLSLLAQGLSNAEIADRLHVSRETVKSHVSSLLRKLGARDRVQLALMAHRRPPVPPATSTTDARGRDNEHEPRSERRVGSRVVD